MSSWAKHCFVTLTLILKARKQSYVHPHKPSVCFLGIINSTGRVIWTQLWTLNAFPRLRLVFQTNSPLEAKICTIDTTTSGKINKSKIPCVWLGVHVLAEEKRYCVIRIHTSAKEGPLGLSRRFTHTAAVSHTRCFSCGVIYRSRKVVNPPECTDQRTVQVESFITKQEKNRR